MRSHIIQMVKEKNDHKNIYEEDDNLHELSKECENEIKWNYDFKSDPYDDEVGGDDILMSGNVTDNRRKTARW